MRLWSIHPAYLDTKGLVAVWREGLLAMAVLDGKVQGYRHHPQVIRFKAASDPTGAIRTYLDVICDEADRRKFSFDRSKLGTFERSTLTLTRGQLEFEFRHLQMKLTIRDPERERDQRRAVTDIKPHAMFRVVDGPVESWERDKNKLPRFQPRRATHTV